MWDLRRWKFDVWITSFSTHVHITISEEKLHPLVSKRVKSGTQNPGSLTVKGNPNWVGFTLLCFSYIVAVDMVSVGS